MSRPGPAGVLRGAASGDASDDAGHGIAHPGVAEVDEQGCRRSVRGDAFVRVCLVEPGMLGLAVLAESLEASSGRGVRCDLPQMLGAVETLAFGGGVDLAVFLGLVDADSDDVRSAWAGDFDALVEACLCPFSEFQFLYWYGRVVGFALHRDAALPDPSGRDVEVVAGGFAFVFLERLRLEAVVLLGEDDESLRDELSAVDTSQSGVVGEGPYAGSLFEDFLDQPHGGLPLVFAMGVVLAGFMAYGFQGEDDAAVRGVRGADGDGEELVSVDVVTTAFGGVAGVGVYAVPTDFSGLFVGRFVCRVVGRWQATVASPWKK